MTSLPHAARNPFIDRKNPFADNIVYDPRDAPASVAGLNDSALAALVAQFAPLDAVPPPRIPPARAPKAQLVISRSQGYGKTHLLGRLFESLEDRAATIYLRPSQDPVKPWRSILHQAVDELAHPLGGDACQLKFFALGVLAHLAADGVRDGGVPHHPVARLRRRRMPRSPLHWLARQLRLWNSSRVEAEEAEQFLRDGAASPRHSLSDHDLIDWLAAPERLDALARCLRRTELALGGRERALLQVLAAILQDVRHGERWSAAIKWLRAEPLEPEEAQALSLTAADSDAQADFSPHGINGLCFERLQTLCKLASFHKPFLFCFDQTEELVGDHALIKALGKCVERLVATLPNHLTIVTANEPNWRDDMAPHIEPPHQDRFSEQFVSLKGVRADVATELVRQRLVDGGFDDSAINAFFAGKWLDRQYSGLTELSARKLLTQAAERFREMAEAPEFTPPTLEALFEAERRKMQKCAAQHCFDADALLWFVKEVGAGLAGVTIERPEGSQHFSLCWQWADRCVYFGFEGGDHHRSWSAIANEAIALAGREGGAFSARALRTPDLPHVPRETWKEARTALESAKAKGFTVVELSADRYCQILAARALHSDALQGATAFDGGETLDWLQKRFAPFLNELAAAPQAVGSDGGQNEIAAGAPTRDLNHPAPAVHNARSAGSCSDN
jgi:hypothetical protein